MRGDLRVAAIGICLLLWMPAAALAQRNLQIGATPAVGATPGDDSRVALVIGNAAYERSPLRNPVNDARAMTAQLERLGFVVIKRENLRVREVGAALREFRTRLRPGGIALFFYAGHGQQVKGVNYLPAVDADITSEEDLYLQSLDLNKILELLDEARTRVNLVFLDACRDNQFARKLSRSTARGLAKMDAPSGTIISFATRPGSVADDGDGQNGLYTEHLLKQLAQPGLPIEQVLKRVGAGVKLASKGKQEPWSEGLIEGEFYFRVAAAAPSISTPAPVTAAVDPMSIELAFWDSIKGSTNLNDFNAYLKEYPNGRFASLARNRLEQSAPTAASPAVQITSIAPPSVAHRPVVLKIQSTWPATLFMQQHLVLVAQKLEKATQGQLTLAVHPAGALVPAFQVLDATSNGVLDGFHAWPHYWAAKNRAAVLFGGAPGGPFGMDDQDLFRWLWDRGGNALWAELYQQQMGLNAMPFPSHPARVSTLGWFKQPLQGLGDLKRLKCRQTGMSAEIFQRLGMTTVNMPGGEIVPAGNRGVIDCTAWAGGIEDLRLGVHNVWKVHYAPGIDANSTMGEFTLNSSVWNRLSATHQQALRSVLRETYGEWSEKFHAANANALRELQERHGVRVLRTPPDILEAMHKAWDEIARDESARNPFFRQVLQAQRQYAASAVASKPLTAAQSFSAHFYWGRPR